MIIPSSYPVKGIFYMLAHPQLFSNLICPIFITLIWGIAALVFGFAYLLKLQAHALINVNCPTAVAWIVCVIFVLLESAVLMILFYLIILPIYQDALFDRVLKLRGFRHVLKQNEGNDVVKCLRGVHGGLLVVFFQIIVLILTLPLNLIPIAGQILYAMINGWILTFALRFHYDAEIRNISVLQSRKEAWARRSEYTSFGSIAVGLEMIPLANLLFMWTNIVGSALWVADELTEAERRHQQEQSSGALMPPYRDSPPSTGSPSPLLPATSNGQFPQGQYQPQQGLPYGYAPSQQPQYGSDPFSNQGTVMVPPKDKRHPQP
ncbi:hypothetical protein BGZ94_002920 [Podila epigama]|nr:hypothetical protein BGZ94_002920 [Podila epigama]